MRGSMIRRVACALLVLVFAGAAHAAELRIDHATVAGADVKAMQVALSFTGIPFEYGGPHANRATEMSLSAFPDGSYLELIAIQPKADAAAVAAHYWRKQMTANAGPTAWAVRPTDIQAEVKRLAAAGASVRPPEQGGRTRPDGVRLEWQTANVGDEPNGTFFPFLITDTTPRANRAYPSGKPTTSMFTGVSRVVIAVRDLPKGIERYRKAWDLPAPRRFHDGTMKAAVAVFEGSPVVLVAPVDKTSWLAHRLDEVGEGPCAFVLKSAGSMSVNGPKSRWNQASVSWYDPAKLGWWLGIE